MISKKKTSIIIILAAMLMSCLSIPTLSVPAHAAAKAKKVVISSIVNENNKVKVVWKNGAKKPCSVYVKKGSGKFKKAGTSSKGSYTFRVKGGVTYTVKVKRGKQSSKAVKFQTNRFAAPKIKSMSVYPSGNKTIARLIFASKKGQSYAVYRKPVGGKWKRIGFIKGKKTSTKYYDTISPSRDYVYTVRRYSESQKGKVHKYGSCDKAGIRTIVTIPKIYNYDATNLQTTLNWNAVEGADGYKTYIKVEKSGTYRLLADTTDTAYNYMYYYGLQTKKEIRSTCGGDSYRFFVDPDSNPFVYIVRAYKRTGSKISYGNHLKDGEYSVITPNILSYKPDTLTWHTVKNADRYNIYTSENGTNWNRYKTVKAGTKRSQALSVPKARFYGVSSLTDKNGVTYESDWDRGFDVSHRSSNTGVNMLWIGCSTEFASPYYNWNDIVHVNSYPRRVAECTGVNCYNPSIPGATMAARYNNDGSLAIYRYRLLYNVLEHVKNGENTDGPYYIETENNKKLSDYDVVVITAGGNDYTDEIPLGELEDEEGNPVYEDTTYYGAMNIAISWIEEANAVRAEAGKAPIKVVFIGLPYSDRFKDKFLEIHNRFTTPNNLGLTYTDYQAAMDNVYDRCLRIGLDAYEIQTSHYVDSETCPYLTSDNVHMTRFTYSQIGNGVARDMIEQGILK